MLSRTFLTILIALLCCPYAWSGVSIEPFVGLSSGNGSSVFNNSNQFEHKYSGKVFGARLNMTISTIYLGLIYDNSQFILDSSQNNTAASDEASLSRTGIHIGKRFGPFWRILLNYSKISLAGNEAAKLNDQFISNLQEYEGDAMGVTISKFVGKNSSINLSYIKNTFKTENSNNNFNFALNEVIFSVALYFGR
jgi:hypothetical protein